VCAFLYCVCCCLLSLTSRLCSSYFCNPQIMYCMFCVHVTQLDYLSSSRTHIHTHTCTHTHITITQAQMQFSLLSITLMYVRWSPAKTSFHRYIVHHISILIGVMGAIACYTHAHITHADILTIIIIYNQIVAVRDQCPSLEFVILMDESPFEKVYANKNAGRNLFTHTFSGVLARGKSEGKHIKDVVPAQRQLSTICYTSGTTGNNTYTYIHTHRPSCVRIHTHICS